MSRASDIDWTFLGEGQTEEAAVAAQGASQPESWSEVLSKTLPILATTYQQQQLAKLNLELIKRGQAPIDAATYARNYQIPAAQVQVGADAQTRQMLMIGGLGLLAVLAYSAAKGGRR